MNPHSLLPKPLHPGLGLVLAIVLGLGVLSPLHAEGEGTDPATWLGLTPEGAYASRGAPVEVFPLAVADQLWQVVHYYSDHSYLFWSSNRVWQVRLDRRWTGSLLGVTMGTPRASVETTLGIPLLRSETESIWDLAYQAFPRRLRLVFVEGSLVDAYLYRSDL